MSALAPTLVNIREAAKILTVSDRTVHTLTKMGQIPSIRVGRALRYSVDDLREYVDSRRTCRPANPEPTAS
jgi:excisionase family DNA binding protein